MQTLVSPSSWNFSSEHISLFLHSFYVSLLHVISCEHGVDYIVRQLFPSHCHNSASYLAWIILRIGLHSGLHFFFINFAFDFPDCIVWQVFVWYYLQELRLNVIVYPPGLHCHLLLSADIYCKVLVFVCHLWSSVNESCRFIWLHCLTNKFW